MRDRSFGWLPFQLLQIPPEEINNPRPEFIEAWNTGKDTIAHYILGDRNAICGKARYIISTLAVGGISTAVMDIENDKKDEKYHWANYTVICKECLRLFKEMPPTQD